MSETPRATIALRPPALGAPRFGHLDVLAAIAALSFLVARFVPVIDLFPPCPFREFFSIPCASCGMTHAFVALSRGHVTAALHASPLGAVGAGAAWTLALLAAARAALRLRWPTVAPRTARVAALAGIAALLVNWAWLVAAGRTHP